MKFRYCRWMFVIGLTSYLFTGVNVMAVESWYAIEAEYVKVISGKEGDSLIQFNLKTDNYDDTHFPFRYPQVTQYKRAGMSLIPYQEKLKSFNCISLDVYPEIPDRAAVWLEVDTVNGKWSAAIWPLKPRQWNRINLGLSNLTSEERSQLKSLRIGNTAMGLLPGDPQWQTYRIRNLAFEMLPIRTESGWQPLNISISRIGFPVDSPSKHAVLPFDFVGKDFKIVQLSNRVTAFSGKAQPVKSILGDFAVADFSDLKIQGRYQLEVSGQKSVGFDIGENPYETANLASMNFFQSMRSGTATAAHPLCFVDDALRGDNRQRVDVSGGWFDASDVRGYFSMAMTNVMRMFCLALDASGSDGLLREEAAWGARHHKKLWCSENGLPYTGLALYPGPELMKVLGRNFYKSNNYWTDNRPGTADDRTVHTPWSAKLCHLDLFSFNAGMTAAGALYSTLSEDEFTKECRVNSERHFNRLVDLEIIKECNIIPDLHKHNRTGNLSLLLESATALGHSTGEKKYFQIAEKLATDILQRQCLDYGDTLAGPFGGWLKDAPIGDTVFCQSLAQEMPMAALLEMANNHPTLSTSKYLEILLRAGIYASLYLKPRQALTAPYNLPFDLLTVNGGEKGILIGRRNRDGALLRAFWTSMFSSGFSGSQSFEIRMLAGALRDTDLYTMSEELLHWQFGENPFSVNMMAGVGDDYKGDMMSAVLGHIPGMISNCTVENGTTPGLPHFRHFAKNEIYTQSQGPFQAALHMHTAPVTVTGIMKNPRPLRAIHSDGKTIFDFKVEPSGKLLITLPKPGEWKLLDGSTKIGQITVFRGINFLPELDGEGNIEFELLKMPPQMEPNTKIVLELTVHNFCPRVRHLTLQSYGINLHSISDWSGDLHPGTNVIKLSATVSDQAAEIAGVIVASKDNRKQTIYKVGIIK